MISSVNRSLHCIREISKNIWRTILKYRAPIFGMAAFYIFGMTIAGTPCVIRAITGFPCPGCGLARATYALLKCNIRSAFNYNPMVFLVWPLLFFIAYLSVFRKNSIKKYTMVYILFGIIMIAVFIVRMIIYFPDIQPLTYDFNSVFGRIIRLIININ